MATNGKARGKSTATSTKPAQQLQPAADRRPEIEDRRRDGGAAPKGGEDVESTAAQNGDRRARPSLLRPSLPSNRQRARLDDLPVIALNLPAAKLSPAMTAYFKKCQDKLGFIPNVLGLCVRQCQAGSFCRLLQRPDAGA